MTNISYEIEVLEPNEQKLKFQDVNVKKGQSFRTPLYFNYFLNDLMSWERKYTSYLVKNPKKYS